MDQYLTSGHCWCCEGIASWGPGFESLLLLVKKIEEVRGTEDFSLLSKKRSKIEMLDFQKA